MSLIAELRSIISQAVNEREVVSGTFIMARFDRQWHAIPTLNEFRQAVRRIPNLKVSKDAQGVLQFSSSAEFAGTVETVQDDDIRVIYEAYAKEIRKK
jgi:hypothetical protein